MALLLQTIYGKSHVENVSTRNYVQLVVGRSGLIIGFLTLIFLLDFPTKIPIEGDVIICSEISDSELKKKGLSHIERKINERNEAVKKKMQSIQSQ